MREEAKRIWRAGIDAVQPAVLLHQAIDRLRPRLADASRILVVGGGKAGVGMTLALEAALGPLLDRTDGIVNVPAEALPTTRRIRLHPARPLGSNFPTREGETGTAAMLALLESAGPTDVGLCLISGGGSALLPAPVAGVSLADKQAITQALHRAGAPIDAMNAVRKHLSCVKGGGFVRAFRGRELHSLILSDVVGDPLDVIASGPTAADPTTFADARAILERFRLWETAPPAVREYLLRGIKGDVPETLKVLPDTVHNHLIGSNAVALSAAAAEAQRLGYRVISLGSCIEGEARGTGEVIATIVRGVRATIPAGDERVCLIGGGETTVTLNSNPGRGGRNQEFVVALASRLRDLTGVVVLSGGTDGEDGPTDAAGAILTPESWQTGQALGDPSDALARHDTYPWLSACDGLLRTGLTGTNVMDLFVVLIRHDSPAPAEYARASGRSPPSELQ